MVQAAGTPGAIPWLQSEICCRLCLHTPVGGPCVRALGSADNRAPRQEPAGSELSHVPFPWHLPSPPVSISKPRPAGAREPVVVLLNIVVGPIARASVRTNLRSTSGQGTATIFTLVSLLTLLEATSPLLPPFSAWRSGAGRGPPQHRLMAIF